MFCSFLALVLRHELQARWRPRGQRWSGPTCCEDLERVQYVEVEHQGTALPAADGAHGQRRPGVSGGGGGGAADGAAGGMRVAPVGACQRPTPGPVVPRCRRKVITAYKDDTCGFMVSKMSHVFLRGWCCRSGKKNPELTVCQVRTALAALVMSWWLPLTSRASLLERVAARIGRGNGATRRHGSATAKPRDEGSEPWAFDSPSSSGVGCSRS